MFIDSYFYIFIFEIQIFLDDFNLFGIILPEIVHVLLYHLSLFLSLSLYLIPFRLVCLHLAMANIECRQWVNCATNTLIPITPIEITHIHLARARFCMLCRFRLMHLQLMNSYCFPTVAKWCDFKKGKRKKKLVNR